MDTSEDRDKDGDMEDIGKVRRGRPKGHLKATHHISNNQFLDSKAG